MVPMPTVAYGWLLVIWNACDVSGTGCNNGAAHGISVKERNVIWQRTDSMCTSQTHMKLTFWVKF